MRHADRSAQERVRVCFLGAARYGRPLDPTSGKKFRALGALGEIYVIGFSTDLRPRRFDEHAHFYLLPDLPSALLRYFSMALAGLALTFWVVGRYAAGIVVAQSPYEGLLGACVKRVAAWFGRRIVLIVESHGDFEESPFLQRTVPLPGLVRVFLRAAARGSLRQADLLRAVSTTTRMQIVRWAGGPPAVVFPAWTDLDVFLAAGHGPGGPASRQVLFAGGLIPQKGVHHLIAAFGAALEAFPDARLTIAGTTLNRRYAAALRDQVKRRSLEDRVQFVPHEVQDRLARRMHEAAVLVLPSVSEGLGRVLIEAMAAGCPVIASRVAGMAEIVEDGRTGLLVPPGDEAALAAAIRWVLSHPDEAREMARRGRRFAAAFFTPQAYLQGYAGLFARATEILRTAGAPRRVSP